MIWVLLGVAVFVGIIVLVAKSNRRKDQTLRTAPAGAVRVEAIKAQFVNRTVEQYARAGWRVQDQTSAKSFGSQARVTLTFVKG